MMPRRFTLRLFQEHSDLGRHWPIVALSELTLFPDRDALMEWRRTNRTNGLVVGLLLDVLAHLSLSARALETDPR